MLIVEDQGIGMSEEMIKHVFDEAFRGNQASKYHLKGSGIGLHIVKETLDRIKAEITIESVIDQGTKVTIKFNK